MTGEGEEGEGEKNCHMLITSPPNEGAVIKTKFQKLTSNKQTNKMQLYILVQTCSNKLEGNAMIYNCNLY